MTNKKNPFNSQITYIILNKISILLNINHTRAAQRDAPLLRTAVQTKRGGKEQEKHIISTFNNSCSVIWYYFHKQRSGLCQDKVNLNTIVAGGSQVLSRG